MVIDTWSSADSPAPAALAALRRSLIFDCCKWDPQMQDISSPAESPIIIDASTWRKLASQAEQLSRETLMAEAELLGRVDLHGALGLPRSIRRALRASQAAPPPGAVRCIRFDFHLTTTGWRISEANTDVPGGFIEAAGMTQLFAAHYPQCTVSGDPTAALAEGVARCVQPRAIAALVHATAFVDDRQVMVYLSRALQARGLTPILISPSQLRWRKGKASIEASWHHGPVDVLLRFFPAEWLCNLDRASGWRHWFSGSDTMMCNPGTALLTQSKRLPLVWDELRTPMEAWRSLLPLTRDCRHVDWRNDPRWLAKPAFGRVGECLAMKGITAAKEWRRIARDVHRHPRHWIAQERFEAVALPTREGLRYPCLGVFVIDGKAAGVYGRIAARPLIDSQAQDVAVLVRREDRPAGQLFPTRGPLVMPHAEVSG